ncbi:hypothetical protein N665_2005s0001 [Sinapis alba]|nr:hypothetical protein N665_2005s0001 [Sinapis alba]
MIHFGISSNIYKQPSKNGTKVCIRLKIENNISKPPPDFNNITSVIQSEIGEENKPIRKKINQGKLYTCLMMVTGGAAMSPPEAVGNPEESMDVPNQATQTSQVLKKYEVDVEMIDGVGSVEVPKEIFKDASPSWEDFLIAKVDATVNKIWALSDKTQMIEVFEVNSTTMKFRITNSVVRNRILRWGMWNLAQVPVVMSKWTPFLEDAQPAMKSIPLWVHLRNVPMDMYSWKGLSFFASPVGVTDRLHPETAQCLNLKETPVEYSYPWLPSKCINCDKWGHSVKACMSAPKTMNVDVPVETTENGQTKESPIQEDTQENENMGKKDDGEEDENKKKEEKGEDDNISHKNLAEENQNEDGEIVEVNVQDAGGKLPLNPGVDWNVEEKPKETKIITRQISSPSVCSKAKGCRGFNKKTNHSVVKEWTKKDSFQFGCMIETRVKEGKAMSILSSVFPGWSSLSNYEYNRLGRFKQMVTCSILLDGAEHGTARPE